MSIYLNRLNIIRPAFELDQDRILNWIAEAHAQAECSTDPSFYQQLKERLFKIGFGKDKIEKRSMQISDFVSENWDEMQIYPLRQQPSGVGIHKRSQVFEKEALKIFETFYPDNSFIAEHLIHVTCTGYVAPSPAQKIVSMRNLTEKTTVTHAYHMGCYAALSALRIGSGYLHTPSSTCNPEVDIVHTELCSLHFHPLKHSTEQLVVQSLFADGFIKYTLSLQQGVLPAFRILSLHEEIIPDTTDKMTWVLQEHGLGMTLAKDVPIHITSLLKQFVHRLLSKAGMPHDTPRLFAVHPGGPKILQQVQQLLELENSQLKHTHQILKSCGNMSSATLPHIWELMLSDDQVPDGTQIVSLAFGPGLSMCGSLFEKRRN